MQGKDDFNVQKPVRKTVNSTGKKVLALKPENLSLILVTHMVGER